MPISSSDILTGNLIQEEGIYSPEVMHFIDLFPLVDQNEDISNTIPFPFEYSEEFKSLDTSPPLHTFAEYKFPVSFTKFLFDY